MYPACFKQTLLTKWLPEHVVFVVYFIEVYWFHKIFLMTKTLGKLVIVLNICSHEVNRLVPWCDNNNLQFNASRTREMIVDLGRGKSHVLPFFINGGSIERLDCFKFLSMMITNDFVGKITQILS